MRKRTPLDDKLIPPLLDGETSDEDELFRQAMEGVTPIERAPVISRRRPHRNSDGEVLDPSAPLKEFLRNGEIETYQRPEYIEGANGGQDRRLLRKLRRGDFAIQGHLDLHGHTQQEAREELERFLLAAAARGLTCVKIIHGKGINSPGQEAVLRKRIPEWLRTRQASRHVVAFTSAPQKDGGSGATYVLLKRRRP